MVIIKKNLSKIKIKLNNKKLVKFHFIKIIINLLGQISN